MTAFINTIVRAQAMAPSAPYIHSIAIARHRKLVFDEYLYGFDATTPHDVRSAGKSVTTLMVGDAMRADPALRADSTLASLMPQYASSFAEDPRKKAITVAHLMTMSSGPACDDNDDRSPGNEDNMQQQTAEPDWYKFTLELPLAPTLARRLCIAAPASTCSARSSRRQHRFGFRMNFMTASLRRCSSDPTRYRCH